MKWRNIKLHGAARIYRIAGIYDIADPMRVPDAHYKIKVLQRTEDDFIAIPNICVRDSHGLPDWRGGSGPTEEEALEDALRALGEALDKLGGSLQRERFEWSDPTEF